MTFCSFSRSHTLAHLLVQVLVYNSTAHRLQPKNSDVSLEEELNPRMPSRSGIIQASRGC